MVAGAALGQEIEERIRLGDPHTAEDIRTAREKGIRQHADRRPDNRDPGLGPG